MCYLPQKLKKKHTKWFFCKKHIQQECIPVGCVPPACCPYLLACNAPGGVYLHGGCTCPLVAHISQHAMLPGGVPAWGVYLPRGMSLPGGVYLPGGVPARGCTCQRGTCPGEGGTPAQGGVCTCWGVYLPRRMHLPRYSPPCEQNSWHTLLKILPCPNFVAGGKN